MAALLNFLVAVKNTNNRHLVWKLRTKLDSASTAKLQRLQEIYRYTNVFSLVSRLGDGRKNVNILTT